MGGGEHAGGNLQLGIRNIAQGKDVEEVCGHYAQLCVLSNIPADQQEMKMKNFREVKKKGKRHGGRQSKETCLKTTCLFRLIKKRSFNLA